jgi:uncharacterized protein YciI
VFHVLTLTYAQPLDTVVATRAAHMDWLHREVDAGRVILAGRLDADRGGVLITGDISTDEAEAVMASDPYQLAGLVHYERLSFTASSIRPPGL